MSIGQPEKILKRELLKLFNLENFLSQETSGARRTRHNRLRYTASIEATPQEVLRAACQILCDKGSLTDAIEPPPTIPTLYGVVGSGFLKKDPALVSVSVTAFADGLSVVEVQALSHEGTFSRRGGEKTAAEIMRLIKSSFQQ